MGVCLYTLVCEWECRHGDREVCFEFRHHDLLQRRSAIYPPIMRNQRKPKLNAFFRVPLHRPITKRCSGNRETIVRSATREGVSTRRRKVTHNPLLASTFPRLWLRNHQRDICATIHLSRRNNTCCNRNFRERTNATGRHLRTTYAKECQATLRRQKQRRARPSESATNFHIFPFLYRVRHKRRPSVIRGYNCTWDRLLYPSLQPVTFYNAPTLFQHARRAKPIMSINRSTYVNYLPRHRVLPLRCQYRPVCQLRPSHRSQHVKTHSDRLLQGDHL